MALLAGAGGIGLKVRLYTNHPVVSAATVLLDLTEANYAGYVPFSSSSWTAPIIETNDDVSITSPIISFPGPTSGLGGFLTGYYVTFEAGGISSLWRVEDFGIPQRLTLPTDLLAFQIRLGLRNLPF